MLIPTPYLMPRTAAAARLPAADGRDLLRLAIVGAGIALYLWMIGV